MTPLSGTVGPVATVAVARLYQAVRLLHDDVEVGDVGDGEASMIYGQAKGRTIATPAARDRSGAISSANVARHLCTELV